MDSSTKTRKRIPHKTQWALDDIQSHCASTKEEWRKLMKIAELRVDPQMAMHLAKARDHIGEIERLAIEASNGEYRK